MHCFHRTSFGRPTRQSFHEPNIAAQAVLHDEARRWMLANDLVPVTLQKLEGRDHSAMGGVPQRLDLVGVAALDHVKSNEWYRHSPPVSSSAVTSTGAPYTLAEPPAIGPWYWPVIPRRLQSRRVALWSLPQSSTGHGRYPPFCHCMSSAGIVGGPVILRRERREHTVCVVGNRHVGVTVQFYAKPLHVRNVDGAKQWFDIR